MLEILSILVVLAIMHWLGIQEEPQEERSGDSTIF